ncbi:NfeD family protein [Sphingomonas sp.]|uniref:NfeD family protein n=1 Tax=Sphingomonas sp. TaxID=28214 RepID=UPI0035BC7EDF
MSDAGWWLIAALALGIAELAVPGVFLVFLAIAATITGVALLALDLPLAAQLASFGVWSVVTVVIGRRWYSDYPVAADARLNDRVSQMIGQIVEVETAVDGGMGRVRVGDGSWPAHGADAAPGEQVRIVAVEGGVVTVEPVR